MNYKGYTGSVGYSPTDKVFYGRVLGISDLISYEGETMQELAEDFRQAVDEYLMLCEKEGVTPQVPSNEF